MLGGEEDGSSNARGIPHCAAMLGGEGGVGQVSAAERAAYRCRPGMLEDEGFAAAPWQML
jgi:hypothetical protein